MRKNEGSIPLTTVKGGTHDGSQTRIGQPVTKGYTVFEFRERSGRPLRKASEVKLWLKIYNL